MHIKARPLSRLTQSSGIKIKCQRLESQKWRILEWYSLPNSNIIYVPQVNTGTSISTIRIRKKQRLNFTWAFNVLRLMSDTKTSSNKLLTKNQALETQLFLLQRRSFNKWQRPFVIFIVVTTINGRALS